MVLSEENDIESDDQKALIDNDTSSSKDQDSLIKEGGAKQGGNEDPKSRARFIKKVYLIFTIMMFSTLAFVGICMHVTAITRFQMQYWPLLIVAIVLVLVIEIAIFCCTSVSRSWPLNVILLVIFTVCFAYLVGFICALADPMEVFLALVLASAGFGAMTLWAYVTDFDLTVWWAVLFGASIALLVFGIVLIFVDCRPAVILFCLLGVILGLVYVAYDTQLIIGGRKYQIDEQEYIPAAMMLYVDFMGIFLYLLELIGLM